MRLLLVEDDTALSASLKNQLERAGFAVDLAENGIDAEHLGREHAYDAVVLDLGLPQRSGLEVLRHWRAAGNPMPVIILTPLLADLNAFRWQYGVLSAVVLAVLVALHAWGVRRGLRPLGALRAELAALEQGEIQRLDSARAPREVQPLVEQINRLLSVLMQRVERSRNAMGNLAHALKTPLAALLSRIEGPELASQPALRNELLRHTQTVRELIERELKRARVVGAAMPRGRYDLASEVAALLHTLRRVYRDKALAISVNAPPAADCPLDREDLHELLGNLLDNACKWARSQVRLSVLPGVQWRFTVEDDGPGVSEAELKNITARGVRIDENTAGHGLGLAIARDLLEHYRGTLRFDASPALGGLRVVAEVPRYGPEMPAVAT